MIKEIIFRILITILVLMGIGFLNIKIFLTLPLGLIVLIASGIISGVYYGVHNDSIWLSPKIDSDKKLKKNPDFKYKYLYKGHQVWIHIVCGFMGGLVLYLLVQELNSMKLPINLNSFGSKELIASLIVLLGYTGLLPRVLWFFSNRGDIKGP